MKRKIVGILVCTLVIAATVLPVAGTVNIGRNHDVKTPDESVDLLNLEQENPKPKPTFQWIIGPLCWLPDCDWNYWSNPPDMYAIPDGNVGIGTSEPYEKLDVNGSALIGALEPGPGSSNAEVLRIRGQLNYFKHGRGEAFIIEKIDDDPWVEGGMVFGFNMSTRINSRRGDPFWAKTHQPVMVLRLTNPDNATLPHDPLVGIGTIEPESTLDVRGNMTIDQDGSALWTDGLEIRHSDSKYSRIVQGESYLVFRNYGGGAYDFKSSDNKFLVTIEDGGNVGIGTTSPAYELDVEGDIQAKAYHVGDIFFQKDGREIWRMFEDENGLYLENLLTGKVYKFVLEDTEETDSLHQKISDLEARIAALEALIQ